ncbi:MAG: hypothetical protein Q9181_001894 [Wetmoreana brouardii]
MPNRRIVQDSDEEDNADESPIRKLVPAPAHPSSPTLTAVVDQGSSSQLKRSIASAGPSTGSTEADAMATERLDREIKDAYNSLLEPSTSRSSRSSHPSSGSPSVLRRRATTEFGEQRVKPPRITYGVRKSQDDAATWPDSEDEQPVRPAKRARKSTVTDDRVQEAVDHDVTSSSSFNGLGTSNGSEGSTSVAPIENHGRGEQNGNTTPDGSMLPLASKSSDPSAQHAQSSEGLRCPIVERTSSPTAAVQENLSVQINVANKVRSIMGAVPDLSISTSATPKPSKRAMPELDLPQITLGEEIPPSSSAPASSPVKRARIDNKGQSHALSTPPGNSDGGHDELSLSAATSPSSNKKQPNANTKTTSTRTPKTKGPGSVDLLPDLPAEKYQPRPSRSRSALTTDDLFVPNDFSKRPEALAKSKTKTKSKRRKTTAFEESRRDEEEAGRQSQGEELSVIDLVSPPKRAADGVGEESTKHSGRKDLATEPAEDVSPPPPQPPQAPPKKSRGRPKKDPTSDPIAETPKTNSSHSKNPDISEPSTLTDPLPPAAPAPAPAKRGRKRKKTVSEDIVQEDPPPPESCEGQDHNPPPNLPLEKVLTESTTHNIQPLPPQIPENTLPQPEPLEQEAAKSSPEKKKDEDAQESARREEVRKESSKNTSPANESKSGKVVYRVGLSKRQRIAPLLRVVRK